MNNWIKSWGESLPAYIESLQEEKFTGNVTIHFSQGTVCKVEEKKEIKPEK